MTIIPRIIHVNDIYLDPLVNPRDAGCGLNLASVQAFLDTCHNFLTELEIERMSYV
jgi:nitrogen-specific signal transduction histidine kinase